MPRNSSGVYEPPTYYPIAGTDIEAAWMNTWLLDLGAALTGSLPRDGSASMNAPFPNESGTSLNPGITYGDELTSGWWLDGVGDIRMGILGHPLLKYTKTGSNVPTVEIYDPDGAAWEKITDTFQDFTVSGDWTISGDWTSTGDWTTSGDWTFTGTIEFDDLTVGGLTVSDVVNVGNLVDFRLSKTVAAEVRLYGDGTGNTSEAAFKLGSWNSGTAAYAKRYAIWQDKDTNDYNFRIDAFDSTGQIVDESLMLYDQSDSTLKFQANDIELGISGGSESLSVYSTVEFDCGYNPPTTVGGVSFTRGVDFTSQETRFWYDSASLSFGTNSGGNYSRQFLLYRSSSKLYLNWTGGTVFSIDEATGDTDWAGVAEFTGGVYKTDSATGATGVKELGYENPNPVYLTGGSVTISNQDRSQVYICDRGVSGGNTNVTIGSDWFSSAYEVGSWVQIINASGTSGGGVNGDVVIDIPSTGYDMYITGTNDVVTSYTTATLGPGVVVTLYVKDSTTLYCIGDAVGS